jgi:hypothetical protein
MDYPVGLPPHLQYLKSVHEEGELFDHLVKSPLDLVAFFECACNDESWLAEHRVLIKRILAWVTSQFFSGRLHLEAAKRVQWTIHEHTGALRGLIPEDFTLSYEDRDVPTNSLLVGTSSPYFYEKMSRECVETGFRTLHLTGASAATFDAAVEYIATGQVSDLWKLESADILNILNGAIQWEVEGLSTFCASIYKRYLTLENAVKFLLRASVHGRDPLTDFCIECINQKDVGVGLRMNVDDKLEFEFYNFRYQGMELFDKLKHHVTHIAFHGNILDDERFLSILSQVDHLTSLNLSLTQGADVINLELPNSIEELDLSKCEWLKSSLLEKIVDQIPNLKRLNLSDNLQLDYHTWGALQKLRYLDALHIARCHQLSDDDLLLISRSCKNLMFIDLSGCKGLAESSLIDFFINMPSLIDINVSDTDIEDSVLIGMAEHCRFLKAVNLSHNKNISEKGLLKAIKLALNLQELVITGCRISQSVLDEILRNHRHLKMI